MKKEILIIDGIPKSDLPFSHVVKAGDFLFLTSQLSVDLRTNEIIGGTIEQQTKRSLDNIKFLLQATGSTMDHIVKIVIYMRDISKFKEMNAVYRKYFKEGEEPARTTVQAPSPMEDIDVEIEVTAVVPG